MNNREQHVLLRLPSIILATQTQTWSYALDYIDRIARLLSSCGSIIVYRIMIDNEEINVYGDRNYLWCLSQLKVQQNLDRFLFCLFYFSSVNTRDLCNHIEYIVQSPNMYFDDVTLNVTIKIGDCQQYFNTNQS